MFTMLLSYMSFTAILEDMFEMRVPTKDSTPKILPPSATNLCNVFLHIVLNR